MFRKNDNYNIKNGNSAFWFCWSKLLNAQFRFHSFKGNVSKNVFMLSCLSLVCVVSCMKVVGCRGGINTLFISLHSVCLHLRSSVVLGCWRTPTIIRLSKIKSTVTKYQAMFSDGLLDQASIHWISFIQHGDFSLYIQLCMRILAAIGRTYSQPDACANSCEVSCLTRAFNFADAQTSRWVPNGWPARGQLH